MNKKHSTQSAPARRNLGEGGFFNLRIDDNDVFVNTRGTYNPSTDSWTATSTDAQARTDTAAAPYRSHRALARNYYIRKGIAEPLIRAL